MQDKHTIGLLASSVAVSRFLKTAANSKVVVLGCLRIYSIAKRFLWQYIRRAVILRQWSHHGVLEFVGRITPTFLVDSCSMDAGVVTAVEEDEEAAGATVMMAGVTFPADPVAIGSTDNAKTVSNQWTE